MAAVCLLMKIILTMLNAEQRHCELMRALDEASRQPHPPAQRRVKQVRRRFAQDANGNILGEEISEEELED